jgi:hypothetical protein
VQRLSILPPSGAVIESSVISPDGLRLAFTAVSDGKKTLWVRALDSLEGNASVRPTLRSGQPTSGNGTLRRNAASICSSAGLLRPGMSAIEKVATEAGIQMYDYR